MKEIEQEIADTIEGALLIAEEIKAQPTQFAWMVNRPLTPEEELFVTEKAFEIVKRLNQTNT